MKNTSLLLIGVLAATVLSCEKAIELDVPYQQPRLVLNGFLNPDSSLTVHLSKSQFVLDNADLQLVSNADILVYEGEESLGIMQSQGQGFYRLENYLPKIGQTYRMEVAGAGLEAVEVQEKVLPEVLPEIIKTDSVLKKDEWGGERLEFNIDLRIPDSGQNNNFYMMKLFIHVKGSQRPDPNEPPREYEFFEPLYLESPDPLATPYYHQGYGLLLNDELFDGKNYRLELKADTYHNTSPAPDEKRTLILGFYHISESAYLYFRSLELNQNTEGDPFAEPVKVFTNVEGGFGILGAITPTFVELQP